MHIEFVTKSSYPIGESWVTVATEDHMISWTDRSFKVTPNWKIKSVQLYEHLCWRTLCQLMWRSQCCQRYFESVHTIIIIFPQWSFFLFFLSLSFFLFFLCSTLLNNRTATFDKTIYSLLVLFPCKARLNTKTVQNQPFSALNSQYAFKVHI